MGRKGRQIFIGGLSPDIDADDLRKFFAEIGGIVYATVWKDSATGLSKGAGKVEFETAELLKKAVETIRKPGAAAGHFTFATVFTDAETSQIDIQYDKAIDWLVSRSKLKEDWHVVLKGLHAKASLANKTIMADDASMAEQFSNLEGSDATAWKETLDDYKSGNAHVAEAARSLMQMVRHSGPAARNKLQSIQKQVQDVERRQKELSQKEVDAKRKFKEMCETHQIPVDTKSGYESVLHDQTKKTVDALLEKAASQIKSSCPEPVKFYEAFIASLAMGAPKTDQSLMPLLLFVAANGNAPLKDAAGVNAQLKAEWAIQSQSDAGIKILNTQVSRGLVVDELVELETFLAERCFELEECEKGNLQQNENVKVQFTLEETKAFHSKVAEAVETLSGKDVLPLFVLYSSQAARCHAVAALESQERLCQKSGKESSELDITKATLSLEAAAHSKEVAQLQAQVKQLKGWLEEELGQLMKYKVHLVGDVDAI